MNVKYFLTLREENNLQSSIYFMMHYVKEGCLYKHALHYLSSVPAILQLIVVLFLPGSAVSDCRENQHILNV